ncbi:serine/threonine-protein kinase [Nocardia sp. NBC_01327]|uniref:serine/threonine-protein kinase n=1 Tax=Nocardia sp. NBC_01327 TaxID=2903593 RepID=UPI002E0F29E0|nr:serine/threonine protein kinase [Nocardia sp. NBC_01327]
MLPGEIFGGYRIEGKLGAGGMGTVYLARHPRLPREDALKVLPPAASADQEFRARFLREAELAARLRHPNIVAIHDRGMDDGCLWIAMQYVQGCDASDLIARDPAGLPPWRAVHIIEEAARGLDAAHAAGLLHRDVKPANILIAVNPDGSYRVLVTDFGIARAVGESTVLTAAGEVLATVSYAAPEQISAAPVDHRVDVYALGCTLHQLLTGSLPFPRPTPAAVMYAHLCEPPPRPSLLNTAVPTQFDDVIARAMAKDPADRYPSCGALALAAAAALRAEPAPIAPPRRSRIRKRTALLAMGFAILVLVAGGAVAWRATSSQVSAAGTSSRAIPPPTTTPASDTSGPWGVYGFVIATFPDLLPPTPVDTGYRGIHCQTMDEEKPFTTAGIPATAPLGVKGVLAALYCEGDGDPLTQLYVVCSTEHIPLPQDAIATFTGPTKSEPWTRTSGSGVLTWGAAQMDTGNLYGELVVAFDNASRNYCQLIAFGDLTTGQDLHDRWWPNVPI